MTSSAENKFVRGSSLAFSKPVLRLFFLGFIILNTLILWEVRSDIAAGYGDFASFYTAGKILREGQGSRLYEPALQWQVQRTFAAGVKIRRGPLPYVRPPFEALLFVPFAGLNYPTAHLIWSLSQICILLIVPFFVGVRARSGTTLDLGTAWLLSLAFFPVAMNLRQGQDSILLLMIFAIAFYLLRTGKDLGSGLVLGAGLFKFALTIPVLIVLLLRRRFSFAFGFLVTASILLALSIAVSGWPAVREYPIHLLALDQATGAGATTATSMPNLRWLCAAFGTSTHLVNSPWIFGAIELALLTATAMLWNPSDRTSPLNFEAGFSLVVAITLFTSYYDYNYDLSLLLIPILTLGSSILSSSTVRPSIRNLTLVTFAILLCTPLEWVFALRFDRFPWIAPVVFVLAICCAALLLTEPAVSPSSSSEFAPSGVGNDHGR